jgi:hypothetical protein
MVVGGCRQDSYTRRFFSPHKRPQERNIGLCIATHIKYVHDFNIIAERYFVLDYTYAVGLQETELQYIISKQVQLQSELIILSVILHDYEVWPRILRNKASQNYVETKCSVHEKMK